MGGGVGMTAAKPIEIGVMITVRWCAGALFLLALIPAFLGVRDWFLALFLFAAFVVAFTPWHRLVADMPAGHPEEVSRLDGIGRADGGKS